MRAAPHLIQGWSPSPGQQFLWCLGARFEGGPGLCFGMEATAVGLTGSREAPAISPLIQQTFPDPCSSHTWEPGIVRGQGTEAGPRLTTVPTQSGTLSRGSSWEGRCLGLPGQGHIRTRPGALVSSASKV